MNSGAMKGVSSLSGRYHTFNLKVNGYIKAEGVNAIILKRLGDTIADSNPIRSVIRGSATNSDGRTLVLPVQAPKLKQLLFVQFVPTPVFLIFVIQPSLNVTVLAPRWVILPSTRTSLKLLTTETIGRDPTEVAGVASVFANSRTYDDPLIIGSVTVFNVNPIDQFRSFIPEP